MIMAEEKLTDRSLWTNPLVRYLKNRHITEYDMKSGGLSVIRENGLLPKDKIDELERMTKENRDIAIGNLQSDVPGLAKGLVDGFAKERERFVTVNGIPNENILSIKKDALFIIDFSVKVQQTTPNVLFRIKNRYTSFTAFNQKELFFSPDHLDAKGFTNMFRDLQKDFLLAEYYRIMKRSETLEYSDVFDILRKYRSDYVGRRLPIGFYRNADTGVYDFDGFSLNDADDTMKKDVMIDHNYMECVLPFLQNIVSYGK